MVHSFSIFLSDILTFHCNLLFLHQSMMHILIIFCFGHVYLVTNSFSSQIVIKRKVSKVATTNDATQLFTMPPITRKETNAPNGNKIAMTNAVTPEKSTNKRGIN